MFRYFIYLAYDGTCYHGWQRQPNAVSVQEKIEEVLQLLFNRHVGVLGAGRTDTGVHARLMVAHIDSEEAIDEAWLAFKLNCLLPPDISIYGVHRVLPEAHARFSATARTYHYYLTLRKDPFSRAHACRFYYPLDFNKMNEAASLLLRHRDFGSFCKAGSDNNTNLCLISQAHWTEKAPALWQFEITADRFLRNMVRAIVGTLIDVGKGRLNIQAFEEVIAAGDRRASGDSMPACGLFLEQIDYPDSLFPEGKAPRY